MDLDAEEPDRLEPFKMMLREVHGAVREIALQSAHRNPMKSSNIGVPGESQMNFPSWHTDHHYLQLLGP